MSEPNTLSALPVERKSGAEPFVAAGAPLGFSLIDFWQWGASDLTGNALRGLLAEYLVGKALHAADGVRTEWDSCDLRATGIAVEVKSAAYLQTWFQKEQSQIVFDIEPKCGWDATTNVTGTVPARSADVYVFALLHHRDKPTLNPLDVDQWTFYVLAKTVLDHFVPNQKSISLNPLTRLGAKQTGYAGLAQAVETCARG